MNEIGGFFLTTSLATHELGHKLVDFMIKLSILSMGFKYYILEIIVRRFRSKKGSLMRLI